MNISSIKLNLLKGVESMRKEETHSTVTSRETFSEVLRKEMRKLSNEEREELRSIYHSGSTHAVFENDDN